MKKVIAISKTEVVHYTMPDDLFLLFEAELAKNPPFVIKGRRRNSTMIFSVEHWYNELPNKTKDLVLREVQESDPNTPLWGKAPDPVGDPEMEALSEARGTYPKFITFMKNKDGEPLGQIVIRGPGDFGGFGEQVDKTALKNLWEETKDE